MLKALHSEAGEPLDQRHSAKVQGRIKTIPLIFPFLYYFSILVCKFTNMRFHPLFMC